MKNLEVMVYSMQQAEEILGEGFEVGDLQAAMFINHYLSLGVKDVEIVTRKLCEHVVRTQGEQVYQKALKRVSDLEAACELVDNLDCALENARSEVKRINRIFCRVER